MQLKSLVELRQAALKNNVHFPSHENVRDLSWNDLHDYRSRAKVFAKENLERIKANSNEERAAELKRHHDLAMELLDEIDIEFEERDAAGTKEPILRSRRPIMAVHDAAADGSNPDDNGTYESRGGWADKEGTEVRVAQSGEQLYGSTRYRGVRLGQVMRAMITGPRGEAEVRALGEGSNGSGGYTVPVELAGQFIDRMRAKSVSIAAGAQTVNMATQKLGIARIASDPVAAWRAENAAVTQNDMVFDRVDFTARSLAVACPISREVAADSVNIVDALETAMTAAMAVAFDFACLYGPGDAVTPLGLANAPGIGSLTLDTNGRQLTWDDLIDAQGIIDTANGRMSTAMIMHPRTMRAIRKLKDGQGNYTVGPFDILGAASGMTPPKRLMTTSIPINEVQGTANASTSLLMGDFKDMLIGMRQEIIIELFREPLAGNLQYLFIAHMRGDVQLAHPASFVRVKGITNPVP